MEVSLNGYDYFLIFFAFNAGMLYYCEKLLKRRHAIKYSSQTENVFHLLISTGPV